MDLSQMLPLLMMLNGGNKASNGGGGMPDMASLLNMMGGKSTPPKSGGGMPDMATLLQMMSLINSGGLGNQNSNGGSTNNKESAKPLNPDMSHVNGMLSPEMLAILSNLARGK